MRTALFVPGDRPDRIAKALATEADGVIVDLEDAVAASQKSAARISATAAILDADPGRGGICVRVNSLASGWLEDDLASLVPVWGRLELIVVPMVPDATTVVAVAALLDDVDRSSDGGRSRGSTPGRPPLLLPLVETAAGIVNAVAIAGASPRVWTLAFGPGDLSNELGVTLTAEGRELLHARSQVVLAAAAAGRARPLDGPWLDLSDTEGLERSSAAARALGFGGRMAIHPAQLDPIRRAFAPDAAELAWARAVVEAFDRAEASGVSSIRLDDGTFVDYPVAGRARSLLAEADASA